MHQVLRFSIVLLMLVSSMAFSSSSPAKIEHFLYSKEVEGKQTVAKWSLKDKEKTYVLDGASPVGTTNILTDKNFQTLSFQHKSHDGYSYTLTKDGNKVHAHRHDANGSFGRTYDISSSPWVQEFDFSFRPFILSNSKRYTFQIIHPQKLSIHTLVATKIRDEQLTVHGQTYDAVRLKMTLTGIKKMFWHADLWYNRKTGNLLKYVANEGPGTPVSTIELKSKKT
ncbi:hypothetical protein COB21_06160 [Candidatus Aerophobetes bacterium]|uniref:DUF3108 domain-containing protein n=1 Tax=Aerophobetes bacterium TaxID=2030807 RepID=A0A2A4WXL4_UNCAE|nr:MAG: hypothetical protein COB21_06160 [Candidatus Aerophobetes bacterium]